MKKILIIPLLCVVMVFTLTACKSTANNEQNAADKVQTANPWTEYDTMDAAENAIGFGISVPESMEGYSTKTIRGCAADKVKLMEVSYSNGDADESKVCIRKAPGTGDISGVYGSYEQSSITVDELSVTMNSQGENMYLATWIDGDYTYSVYNSIGSSEEDMIELISQIQ